MGWMIFEIAINCFQALLILLYVKRCFVYAKTHPIADAALFTSCAGLFTLSLFVDFPPGIENAMFILPVVYVLALSREPRVSSFYWMMILDVVFNLVSVLTYPLFESMKIVLHFQFPAQTAVRMIVTNILLFFVVVRIIRLKQSFPLHSVSGYASFMLMLIAIWIIDEALFALYSYAGTQFATLYFVIYAMLTLCTLLSISLFASNAIREYRHQAELALSRQSQKHQQELTRMYEDLTERRHDYKHHLQMLEELIGIGGNESAREYIDTMVQEFAGDNLIITGSQTVDALLAAKQHSMSSLGIEFQYTPYPLRELPISATDFCRIVGNLLDNAIEGVQHLSDTENKRIHLTFSRSWDMFYIYCENPCDPSTVKKRNGRFVSSKDGKESELHGIGISSIEAIVSRAEGRTKFAIEDGIFKAKVVLPYLRDEKAQACVR